MPAVTTLCSDPDKAVRMRCVDACGAVVVNTADPDVRLRAAAVSLTL